MSKDNDPKPQSDEKKTEQGKMSTSQRLKQLANQGRSLDVNDLDKISGGVARTVLDGGGGVGPSLEGTVMCGW
jgi:hypothetical protein